MATHNYSTEIELQNIPNWVDGDRVDLSGLGKLIVNQSASGLYTVGTMVGIKSPILEY